ncbi:MAG: class I adenylate-forming enzyme family protein, partial [Acidimicrobiales bacterium]
MKTASWREDEDLPPEARAALTGPGAPFEMVTDNVLGVAMRVFASRPRFAAQMLVDGAALHGDRPFLIFDDRTLTFCSILEPVAAVAASLAERFGIGRGERVAIASANSAAHAVTAWALVSLGVTVVELNAWWTGPELLDGVALTKPTVVLADDKRLARLRSTGSEATPAVSLEDGFASWEEDGRGAPMPQSGVGEDEPLAIMFTSGTTGRAKGAVLSHRNHVHMVMQAALQGAIGSLGQSRAPEAALSRSCTVAVSPMFHVSGFSVQLIGGPFLGATFVYPPPGRWDPDVHLALSANHRAAAWSLVPAQLWRLLEHPRLGDYDLSALRRVSGGGATFDPELWRQVGIRLPQVTRMATGYGMTETCGAGTHHDGEVAREHPEAVGRPVAGMEIQVRDPSGASLEEGTAGVIHVRGPCGFLGYWEDPAATSAALDEDRWYRTGELGHLEDGILYLDGRGSDLIVRGGENVYAIEVENRLLEHPDVLEAAVVGRPHRI